MSYAQPRVQPDPPIGAVLSSRASVAARRLTQALGVMILNNQARSAIAHEWATVKKFCAGSHRQSMMVGGFFINETPPESFYNLPFLLAYGVLDHVLEELVGQRTFQLLEGPLTLGNRMFSSVNVVPWQNFELVDAGKTARNELAHDAKLLSKTDCFRFIDAIEIELKAWGVLVTPIAV